LRSLIIIFLTLRIDEKDGARGFSHRVSPFVSYKLYMSKLSEIELNNSVFISYMQYIVDICNQLGIIDFIENLPEGFQTYLRENGAKLSGGQKQRIAIARALYRKAEILILDEATSSLDSESEKYVQSAIDLLLKEQKTAIVIAHRFSTIKNADKIIVLDKGKVVEEGRHEQMILAKGYYSKMYQAQFV